MNEIFSNPGYKLKAVAKICFILGLLASITVFIIGIFNLISTGQDPDTLTVPFLLVLLSCILIFFVSFVISLVLYAFGEHVESGSNTAARINDIEYHLTHKE